MKLTRSIKVVAAAAVALASLTAPSAYAGVTITGTGSSFATPLISTCKMAWQSTSENTVSYSGGGSGAGRANTDNGIGDLNFSDASYAAAKSTILQIPAIAAPVAISYNKTGFDGNLYLSPETLSGIFAGKITKWNDPAIKADNSGKAASITYKKDKKGKVVKVNGKPVIASQTKSVAAGATDLPNETIRVVYRSDSSGTTQNLVNFFIKKFSSTWTKPSSGTFASVYPGGDTPASWLSASGTAGVAALAQRTPYSVTYIESSYAGTLGKASIKNASGNYQAPDAPGTAAFLSAATVAADGKVTFDYETKEPGAYILGIVSYGLVDSARKDSEAKAVTSFLKYLTSDACTSTRPELEYTPISGKIKTAVDGLIAKLPN